MTRVAIHQPNYFPWIGYFYKIARVDVFVFLDDVDYQAGNAKSVTNRAKIKTAAGPLLLSVPVSKAGGGRLIRDIRIDYTQKWLRKHLLSLRFAYARSPFLREVLPLVETLLESRPSHLAALNEGTVRTICDYLGVRTSFVVSSDLGPVPPDKNMRIVEICRRLGASVYLSGSGARRYNDEELFIQHGLVLEYADFHCPEYQQLHGSFVPNLSILDAVFSCGAQARHLLT